MKTQEQDRAIDELSFLERLALLVDQQWAWRENQALARRLKAAKLRGPDCVEDIDYCAARGLDKTVVRVLARDSSGVRNHENIFVLVLMLQWRFISEEIAVLDQRLEQIGTQELELAAAVARWVIVPGIDRVAAWSLVAEVGNNMAQFPTAAHLASWAGL